MSEILNIVWMIAIFVNIGLSILYRNVELGLAWTVAALALGLQFIE